MHTESSTDGVVAVDRLAGLLDRFHVSAKLLDAAPLRFPREYVAPGRGHLHLVRSGTLEAHHAGVDGGPARLVIEEPTLLLYPASRAHRLLPGSRPVVACAELELGAGDDHPLARALPAVVQVPLAAVAGLGGALGLLFAEIDHVRCGHRQLADRLLEVVLIQLLRWLFDHPAEGGVDAGLVAGMADPRLARVLTAVHEEPAAPWTLDRMARVAAMSRSSFAETFREVVGETPAAYVTGWRIALAQRRLIAGEPLAALAGALGYANPSGLSRAFSARTGQAPSAWLAARR